MSLKTTLSSPNRHDHWNCTQENENDSWFSFQIKKFLLELRVKITHPCIPGWFPITLKQTIPAFQVGSHSQWTIYPWIPGWFPFTVKQTISEVLVGSHSQWNKLSLCSWLVPIHDETNYPCIPGWFPFMMKQTDISTS